MINSIAIWCRRISLLSAGCSFFALAIGISLHEEQVRSRVVDCINAVDVSMYETPALLSIVQMPSFIFLFSFITICVSFLFHRMAWHFSYEGRNHRVNKRFSELMLNQRARGEKVREKLSSSSETRNLNELKELLLSDLLQKKTEIAPNVFVATQQFIELCCKSRDLEGLVSIRGAITESDSNTMLKTLVNPQSSLGAPR